VTIAEAVRSLRKRLGKSQMEFAELLGCQRNTVSRYEIGAFLPSPFVLVHLLGMAETAGTEAAAESETITRELKAYCTHNLVGGGRTVEETIAMMRLVTGATFREIQRSHSLLAGLPEQKIKDYGFRQFAPAVAHVVEACGTVDQSVADILHLWAAHWHESATVQHFRAALEFLRFQLFAKDSAGKRPNRGKK